MAQHCRIALTEDEQRVVDADRDGHPVAHVRLKMLFVWSCHHGVTRATAGAIAGVSRSTAHRHVAVHREGGLPFDSAQLDFCQFSLAHPVAAS